MCHHQDGHRRTAQHVLQPFNHFQVEVVGRLVEDEQVRLSCQHSRQGDALDLSTAQLRFLSCRFLLRYFHLCEEPLVPLQVFLALTLQRLSLDGGRLFQIPHFQVIAENHRAAIVTLLSCDDAQQGGFSRTVLGNEPDVLTLVDGERDVSKQHAVSDALGQTFDFEIGAWHRALSGGDFLFFGSEAAKLLCMAHVLLKELDDAFLLHQSARFSRYLISCLLQLLGHLSTHGAVYFSIEGDEAHLLDFSHLQHLDEVVDGGDAICGGEQPASVTFVAQ